MKQNMMIIGASLAMTLCSCANDIEMRRPPVAELPDLPVVEDVHVYKAPLYWSVYEYCYDLEQNGVANADMDITIGEWDRITDWVATDLKPYGYDMVCTDGFIPMNSNDDSGYMTHYGSASLKELVEMCRSKGLKVGVYDNPLWIHGPESTKVPGTDYTFGSLAYNGSDAVMNPSSDDMWFKWVVASRPGAREYIDGFFKHYADLGINFIRMDFLSWYEDGKDRNLGTVGKGYGREEYARALAYIAESAKKYGIFTSLVMPHLNNDAEVEAMYGNMVRIVADTGNGGWGHCSANDRGVSYANWPNCMNMFDGMTYWSHIAGRDKVILDGDFIRLNKFDTDAEKETVVTLQLIGGGPVAVADQYSTIGDNTRFYTNSELLALNTDRFVAHPLSDQLNSPDSRIWFGTMSDGSTVVALFNRDDSPASLSVDFATLGLDGQRNIRDLWLHRDEAPATSVQVTVPAHGCKVYKLTK